MNLLKRLNNSLPEVKATGTLPLAFTEYGRNLPRYTLPAELATPQLVGNEITLYPQDGGERFIKYGYNLNDAVYSIVSRNAEKAGQVRLYHSRIKASEAKTLNEYNALRKGNIFSKEVVKEMRRMRKAMVEDKMVDSPLSKLLNKPNRYQSQSEWIENLFGLRELQGEGNIWFNRGADAGKVKEMLIIPKPFLNLVGDGADPFTILAYEFNLNGNKYRWAKEDIVMWKYSNPGTISTNLEHMRGLAPLQAAMVLLQGLNEGDVRVATSNKHGGASGLAYQKPANGSVSKPTPEQALETRKQFNNAVNNNDMAGKIAILSGEWGYHNFAVSVKEQQLLEQYGFGFQRLCNVFKTPAELFGYGNDTYENRKQYKRDWVYDKIAPNIYGLSAKLNDKLLPEFGLDPETNLIDCDIMALPELGEDMKDQVAALKDAIGLTVDQRLMHIGYEPIGGELGATILVPSGYTTLKDINADMGKPLDEDELSLGV